MVAFGDEAPPAGSPQVSCRISGTGYQAWVCGPFTTTRGPDVTGRCISADSPRRFIFGKGTTELELDQNGDGVADFALAFSGRLTVSDTANWIL